MDNCRIHKNQIHIMLFLCIVPIVICIMVNLSLIYSFLLGVAFASTMSIKNWFTLKNIEIMVLVGVSECKNLYIVILLIGATVSVWLSSGVVSTMIYYGLEYSTLKGTSSCIWT
jgi:NhaC family Na+:H+ antiporter